MQKYQIIYRYLNDTVTKTLGEFWKGLESGIEDLPYNNNIYQLDNFKCIQKCHIMYTYT